MTSFEKTVPSRRPRRTGRRGLRVLAAVVVSAGALVNATGASAEPTGTSGSAPVRPTVVLVHGAWADSGAWNEVVAGLQRDGYPVDVFPTPLQSLAGDSAALRAFLGTVPGPVVLVGHSYGGAVVSDAATGLAGVQALVYLDAFAPDTGEPVAALAGSQSVLAGPDPTQVFGFAPAGTSSATELYVLPQVFVSAFANDLPQSLGRVLAATQRPVTLEALGEPSTEPAWRTIPSWYEVGTLDKVIPPAQQRFMAQRAGAHVVEAPTSHLPMVSQPRTVVRTVEAAARG